MSADSEVTLDISQQRISANAVSLFVNGFYREAIRHEAQDLLNEIRERSGQEDLDGQRLVQAVLADRNPFLAFNDRETRQEQNLHASLRYLMLGVMAGVRNVYTHDVRSEVAKDDAAMWLVLMGQLRTQIERLDVVTSP